jgi:UDP-N-acetylmuramoylalanine--D-glutamate ligase
VKVAVIGYGVEGKAAYKYWCGLGHDVTIHDENPDLDVPTGAKTELGPDYLKRLDWYDLVVRSAGVKPWLIKTKARVTSGTEEFFLQCPARIIGVTGTKGKGTTATLIARILGESGWRTWVGGNIGQSPLGFLDKVRANHLVVLELSSFQLMDLDVSPHIAVCLSIVPEHLDWHRNFREYVSAKGNIFWHQAPGDLAVYNARNEFSEEIARLSPGEQVPYMKSPGAKISNGNITVDGSDVCRIDEVGLIGPHNLENICAAITATWDLVKRQTAPVKRAVTAFTGLEHRLEFVRAVGGISWINDSFSTTPETAMAAINSFAEPKILIMGGSDKKSDYRELAGLVAASNVRFAILIGDRASVIESDLRSAGFGKILRAPGTMPEIVTTARSVAMRGDVVLLSPACASYDQFSNYRDRGNKFKAAVGALK